MALLSSFSHLFSQLGLSTKAVTASFGCKVNPAICLQVNNNTLGLNFPRALLTVLCMSYPQGIHNPESDTVYVDQRALRVDR